MLHSFKPTSSTDKVLNSFSLVLSAISKYPEVSGLTLDISFEDSKKLDEFFRQHNIPCVYITETSWAVSKDRDTLLLSEARR